MLSTHVFAEVVQPLESGFFSRSGILAGCYGAVNWRLVVMHSVRMPIKVFPTTECGGRISCNPAIKWPRADFAVVTR